MAKGNQKYQRERAQREADRSYGEFQNFIRPLPAEASNLREQGQGERGYLTSGLRGFAETGGFSPEDISRLREIYETNLGGSAAATAGLSDFGEERGYLRDFAQTGGYTPQDIQRIRAQAASSAPSFYNAIKSQMDRGRAISGANINPGADQKLLRNAAQQAAQDRLGANIGLSESQRAGKQYGISGLVDTSTIMGDQALRRAGLMDNYNLSAASMKSGIESDIQKMIQSGKQYGLSSLQNLYGQDYAPLNNVRDLWLKALGQQQGNALDWRNVSLRNDDVNRSRFWENVMRGVGAGGGIIGAFKGGGGS